MKLEGITIDETFAEAFGMNGTRLIVTADSLRWAETAGRSMTGFATSVIGCGVEAGIERALEPDETPDSRPGVAVLLFGMSRDALAKALIARVGQCVLTTPGSACYGGLAGDSLLPLGRTLRYFGDGHQRAKRFGDKRYWRIPVMDGEFVCEDKVAEQKAVGGGNFLILGKSRAAVLCAAERAITAMDKIEGAIMPFPGGVVRSGSKVGSRYKFLSASTNDAFCPTLKGLADSELDPEVAAVLEIVIDGLDEKSVAASMEAGIRAVCSGGTESGITRISAGNYGGKLGPFHFHLKEILS
jgi:formylmethanofuran--tetrahydromethanopterin N-formyltransferase